MPPISVLVVDDHTLMRQGVVGLLNGQPDISVAAQTGDGESALQLVAEHRPDIVLMDIGMPGVSGLIITAQIKERFEDVQVLMLTMHEREDYLFQALRAGASGYVLKGAEIGELLEAVRTVAEGRVYVYQSMTDKLVSDYLRRARTGEEVDGYDGLSEREREVLGLIADGNTTPQIAAALNISPHTVQTHRNHIMAKLDLHSKTALTKYAIRKGLIQLDC